MTLFNRLQLDLEIDRLVGDFTSITLLAVDASELRFRELAQQVQRRLWEDLDHRHYSGIEVLRELNRRSGSTRPQTMPVVFTSALGLQGPDTEFKGLAQFGEEVFALSQTSQTWLDHQVSERDGTLRYCWDVLDALFPPGVIQDMFDRYHARLLELAGSSEAWTEPRLAPLPADQAGRRRAVNATDAAVSERCLHDLVWERARSAPDSAALFSAERRMSYAELRSAAFALGARLLDGGAAPGDRVVIALRKGWRQVVATLACSSVRAVYVPVDPEWPAPRLRHILEQTQARAILAEETLPWAGSTPVLRIYPDEDGRRHEHDLPVEGCNPDDLAYIIYTSGSTGVPKGVAVDHRGAVNTVLDVNRRFGIRSTDRLLGLSALSFDLSVYDIFGVLAAGAALVLPAPEEAKDPVRWIARMREHRVTVWNTVPALLQMLLEYLRQAPEQAPCELRLAMLSGDWLPLALPDNARKFWPTLEIYSLGGATEASIWSVCYPVERVDSAWPSIPYGRPLANQRFHVLDGALQDRPDWVTGELYIGGVGLARGYWRDEEQTRARFIEHPVSGERLYRTGDLGCYLPDGEIRFQGRADTQVKIAGHRIELGEVAGVLRQAPGVTAAEAVLSDQQIVGFAHRSGAAFSAGDLHQWCADHLPAYMLPKLILPVAEWPLSANGKLDARRLREQAEEALRSAAPAKPRRPPDGELESEIAELWRQVLQRAAVGRDENFFEAGGDSLLATRLYGLLRQTFPERRELSVVNIFQYPTVALQARLIGQHEQTRTSVERGGSRRRRLQALAANAGRAQPADTR